MVRRRSVMRRAPGVAALVACAAALAVVALGSGSALAAAPGCSSSNLEVWFGLGLGGGTAGTIYYPLEFSNVSHHTCTLYGYPGVSPYRGPVAPVGLPADHSGAHRVLVTLTPGATAHALLGVHDWGAICSHATNADGLKIYPPGSRGWQSVPFAFGTCAHRGTLTVGPVRAGVGVPGYTTA